MAILNNIAFGHEMKPIFQYGFYAGTLGNTIFGRLGGLWLAFKAPQGQALRMILSSHLHCSTNPNNTTRHLQV